MYLHRLIQPMYILHLRGKYALGGLDLNTWVYLIPKETSFIDPTVRQTPHIETIHHQLKGQDNTTKQEQNKENQHQWQDPARK
jgi:hypothetical protein